MSPNSTSKLNKSLFQSYFWPALLALLVAIVLSQWAVADPQEVQSDQEAAEEQVDPPEAETPLEIPPMDGTNTESEYEIKTDERVVEPVPDPVLKQATPVGDTIPLSEKCYEQKDGSFECVCEGDAECETLKTAEHCEPGTHWGKDGFGGCTKKSPE